MREYESAYGGQSWYSPPALDVVYDSAIQLVSPANTLQLYTIRVRNNVGANL